MNNTTEHPIFNSIKVLEARINTLLEEVKGLYIVNDQHRKLNGALRAELAILYKEPTIPTIAEDDFPDECILCGTDLTDRLKEMN